MLILSLFHVLFACRNKDAGAYDLGELDQALFLYLDGHEHPSVQEQKRKQKLS